VYKLYKINILNGRNRKGIKKRLFPIEKPIQRR